jgi:hypothetical protein
MTLKLVKKEKEEDKQQETKTEVDKNIVNSYHVVKGILKGRWNKDDLWNYI